MCVAGAEAIESDGTVRVEWPLVCVVPCVARVATCCLKARVATVVSRVLLSMDLKLFDMPTPRAPWRVSDRRALCMLSCV